MCELGTFFSRKLAVHWRRRAFLPLKLPASPADAEHGDSSLMCFDGASLPKSSTAVLCPLAHADHLAPKACWYHFLTASLSLREYQGQDARWLFWWSEENFSSSTIQYQQGLIFLAQVELAWILEDFNVFVGVDGKVDRRLFSLPLLVLRVFIADNEDAVLAAHSLCSGRTH